MALVLPPEFWDNAVSDPKRKFKFFVQFGDKSLINEVYPKFSYMWMIKSVSKPKPSLDTKEASDPETRTWFGYIPDPNKRNLGTVSWAPIQIKFINPVTRQERQTILLNLFHMTHQI